jgi:hypothetical protein
MLSLLDGATPQPLEYGIIYIDYGVVCCQEWRTVATTFF